MAESTTDLDALAGEVSALLEGAAEELVTRWIDWIRERVGTSTVHSLPDQALRNHIPPVIRSVARYVEVPLEAVRADLIGHLELHGHLRWQQGYGIEELLAEFDGLAHLITGFVQERLTKRTPPPAAYDLMEVVVRLSAGLRAIGYVTVSIYRQAESEHRREIARHLDDFAATMAHEIRGPMNTLSLGLDLVAADDLVQDASKQRKHLAAMARALQRMADLVDNLRILGAVEGAQSKGRHISLTSAIQGVRETLARSASERGVVISVEGNIAQVSAASVPVQLALMNLVSNSIKYHDPAKAQRWCRISVRTIVQDGSPRAEIAVEDNGRGIPADLQEAVLQRHIRAHPAVAEGTGLGLDITRQVLMRFGGTIKLASQEGQGTTVSFRLPVIDKSTVGLDSSDLTKSDLTRIAVESLDASRKSDD